MTNIDEKLQRYAAGKCTKEEAAEISSFLARNPHMIISFLAQLRRNDLNRLGFSDTTKDGTPVYNIICDPAPGSMTNALLIKIREMLSDVKNSETSVPSDETEHREGESKQKNTLNMETINFTTDQLNSISANAANIVENINSELSTLSNMTEKLLANEPSLTPEGAAAVCRSLIEGVTNFDKAYKELCKAEPSDAEYDEMLYNMCIENVESLTPEQQAAALLNFIALVKTLDASNIGRAMNQGDATSFNDFLNQGATIEGTVDQATLDELKELLRETLAHNTICLTGLEDERQFIAAALASDATLAQTLSEKKISEADYKAYAALAAYIALHKGELESEGADATPEALGAAVAAGIEREKVTTDAAKGRISWEKACKYLKYIGGALLYAFLGWIALNLGMYIMAGTVLLTVGAIGTSVFTILSGLVLGTYLAVKGATWFMDNVTKPAAEAAEKAYDTIVNFFKNNNIVENAAKAYHDFVAWLKARWSTLIMWLTPRQSPDAATVNA